MKAKNFRIGNLITAEDKVIEIGMIKEKFLSWNVAKYPENKVWNPFIPFNDERIKGIYLSYKTEHLLKSNLRESDENGYYKLTDELDINIDFCVYCGRKFLIELTYVHQLQNLFFAFTSTELDVSKLLSD